jgi:NAD(P)H dehydrogenase (quinone)
MILITGASGHIGRRTAELLAEHGHSLRLLVRDPNRAPKLSIGQVVQGDYASPATLNTAFAEVDSAFIVSGYAKPGERALLHKNAIDAAARAHVKHLVYLSFQGASPESKFPMSQDHYQTEQFLKESGISFTVLRDNLYLDLIPEMFNSEGVMRGPAGDGVVAWISREDVARVVAAVLSRPNDSCGIYDVTGSEALTMTETAKRLSALVGRELRYENESVEEGRKWRSMFGVPDWEVDTWLGSYEAIAAGELEQISDTVLRITGSQPFSLEVYFAERPHLLDHLRGSPIT